MIFFNLLIGNLWYTVCSGGFRNLERGFFQVATPTSGCHTHFRSRWQSELNIYLEATLGLVKCLEISKELIRECVTMPGCCCCMPLLQNHLMDSCSYVRKNTLLATKGGCICTPLTPLNPPLLCDTTTLLNVRDIIS